MKAISLTEPWAQLVALGAKRVETRSWATAYRGPLAIHAAKGFPGWAKDLCVSTVFLEALGWPRPNGVITQSWLDETNDRIKSLPRGVVLATCRLVECVRTEKMTFLSAEELAFGDYSPGRWAWILEDITVLPEPVPAKGALGLWEWAVQPSNSGHAQSGSHT